MSFSFVTSSRIVFGGGEVRRLGEHLAAALAGAAPTRALIVTGSRPSRVRALFELLDSLHWSHQVVTVSGEPTVEDAQRAVQAAREVEAQVVVACGGGSAIDLAKAAALLAKNPGQPLDYLEVIGRGEKPAAVALPVVALPTTSGTGAEVTKNAVLASPEHRVKVSLRHDSMLPALALVDPELTWSVPASVTAATGLDALTQCIEPYLSCLSNPLTDGIARQGIEAGARSLRRAVNDGSDVEAREGMALCSLFGGLSLANAKLGAVHGFAGPFGGMFESPHGAVCARLLPQALLVNQEALRSRVPTHPSLGRLAEVARLLTGRDNATTEDGIEWLERLVEDLQIPRLASYGMTEQDLQPLVEKAARSSSMKGNPIELTQDELRRIAAAAL